MRDHDKRLGRLEARSPAGAPYIVFGSTTIPDDPITDEVIEGWLRDGLASRAYGLQHVIKYHGGRTEPLTVEEWERQAQEELRKVHADFEAKRQR